MPTTLSSWLTVVMVFTPVEMSQKEDLSPPGGELIATVWGERSDLGSGESWMTSSEPSQLTSSFIHGFGAIVWFRPCEEKGMMKFTDARSAKWHLPFCFFWVFPSKGSRWCPKAHFHSARLESGIPALQVLESWVYTHDRTCDRSSQKLETLLWFLHPKF